MKSISDIINESQTRDIKNLAGILQSMKYYMYDEFKRAGAKTAPLKEATDTYVTELFSYIVREDLVESVCNELKIEIGNETNNSSILSIIKKWLGL